MSNQPIIMIVNMKAREGYADDLRDVLGRTARLTREEEGCMLYELLEARKATGSFVVVEKWRDQTCFRAHQESAHLKEAFASFDRLLAGPPVFEPWVEVV
jgi:quinol monooxygenase YgiN